MKSMTAAEIREAFLAFYEKHGHQRVASSSLIPVNDPTLLFTSAGMVQFKDVFTGIEKRSYTRATTAQRCLRAGGKHNDLENVGFTKRHHTFFEMLGNFSFGDYFKKEAIHYAWDLVTNVFKLPKDRLYVTIHVSDDEAFQIWTQQEKLPAERVSRLDADNFWSAGDVGPCGPCTEIYYDRGEKYNTGDPKKDRVGGDGDRYLEFYNLVFMQYERDERGVKHPLPKPCVDTGMGLERTSSIIQDVDSNYDIDLFVHILRAIKQTSPLREDSLAEGTRQEYKFAAQVVADHLRAVTFLIADGLLPSNEGRGYVLRRILRRAVRFGKQLGFIRPFLHSLVPVLVDEMGDVFPLIREKSAFIRQAIASEEEKFFATLEKGLHILSETLAKLPKHSALPGKTAFLLYDSFGFPLDLTQVIARESGFTVDEAGFHTFMAHQKSQSRKEEMGSKEDPIYSELEGERLSTNFMGYSQLCTTGKILALVQDGARQKKVTATAAAEPVQIIFDVSPFYAEGGGQVGDRGEIYSTASREKIASVMDVKKPVGELIVVHAEILPGKTLEEGKSYHQEVPAALRSLIAANHSATHLVHWALREVLGDHVKQAGSLVNSELLRFDFTHFRAMTSEEIARVENLVNEKISVASPVTAHLMDKDAAISAGAMALFGEKYGAEVRVLQIGDYSTELCGGTHVENTSQIRLFQISSEGGIAAGIRRIIALTSTTAIAELQKKAKALDQLRQNLKAQSAEEVLERVDKLQSSLRDLEKRWEKAAAKNIAREAQEIARSAKRVGSISLLVHTLDGDMNMVRSFAEQVRQHLPSGVIAIGARDADKAILFITVSKDLLAKVNAGKIIQEIAPYIQGRGGGKPDAAQAGGSNAAGIPSALAQVSSLLASATT